MAVALRLLNIFMRKTFLIILTLIGLVSSKSALFGQNSILSGKVSDSKTGKAIEFASVLLKENGLWAITSDKGIYTIKNVPQGTYTAEVQCMGYASAHLSVKIGATPVTLDIPLAEDNLMLDVVEVVAKRGEDNSTTSYKIDRTAIEHQQTLNLIDITSLLPGGRTLNSTLMDDSRLTLRSGSGEKGNASFGTAIEVDGVRIDNNAIINETSGASTRNISSSNIESVEIIAGIPSVEYGDLSNGVVKVNVRKGKSPLIIETSVNPHTRIYSVNKGIGIRSGILNISAERGKSFSNIASPYTAYQRNILSLKYLNTLMKTGTPLTIEVGLTGNMGGYNSGKDPDETLESYTKIKDNLLSGNFSLKWLLGKKWLTNLSLKGNFSFRDKKAEEYYNASSASSQPYIHTTEEGYFIAEDYSLNPSAAIILGPTGYWYVRGYSDQKPVNFNLKLKAELNRQFGSVRNNIIAGADFQTSFNNGRGTYYEDMRLAPTWREYRYDKLPALGNLAIYAEDRLTVPFAGSKEAILTAGIRDDITMISGSDYGTVSSLSPRTNLNVYLVRNSEKTLRSLSVHAGWGRSFKLPSFQVLYPSPSYSDILTFTPGSTIDNRAYYAYYTFPSAARYNPALKWQYTDQTDFGFEADIKGTRISVSVFNHKTANPYMAVNNYTPFKYLRTGQSAIEGTAIPSADRRFSVDKTTGLVTLYDRTGTVAPVVLSAQEHHTYNSTRMYTNGNNISRYGVEWIVDFAQIKAIRTSVRIDGNYYYYKGIDETLFPTLTGSIGNMSDPAYPLLAYYRGSSSTSADISASASTSNGSESRRLGVNATVTTHIPSLRLIVTLKVESTLYNYKRTLSEYSGGKRGIVLKDITDYFGEEYDKSMRDRIIAVYPEYYSTWDNPGVLIPFKEKFEWAKENDRDLYNNLARLIVKSNYAYTFNPSRISEYFSANFSVTKEIGNHVSLSFYANNFFNNMGKVKNSQTGLTQSLFGSSYIPKFYYGMSIRIKI